MGRTMLMELVCLYVLRFDMIHCWIYSKEKTLALYALDVLEGTGIQVLSRRNIQGEKM